MRILVVVLALLCSACSATDVGPSSTAHSPSPRSTARTFTSARFTTTVPAGWSDATGDGHAVASVGANGRVLMLLVVTATAFNEHIDVSVAPQPTPDDQLAGYLQSVAQSGATNLSPTKPFALDGGTGIFVTYNLMSTGGSLLKAQDMVINHGGDTFDIVLNTADADFTRQLPAVQSILDSWKWVS